MSEALSTALPPVKRRNAELVMLLAAIGITLFAMIEASLTRTGEMPPSLFVYATLFGGLAVLAHVFIRFFAPYADPLLLPLATLLNGLGIAMLWRLFDAPRIADAGEPGESAMTQLILTAISLVVFAAIVFFLKEPRVLQRYPYLIGLGAVVLLLMPLIPGIGRTVNGARQWVYVGFTTLQPSEFAKIALVIFLAGYMVTKRDVLSLVSKPIKIGPVKVLELPRMRDMAPMAIMWGFCIIVMVILMNDLGTSLLLFGTFLAMIYVATQRSSWIVLGLGAFFGACALLYPFVSHFRVRMVTWLGAFDPNVFCTDEASAAGTCFASGNSQQLVQGLFALGEGGVLGTGLGGGRPGNVPEVENDFIFAAFGEELGLTGVMVILLVLALLAQRGMRIALASRELFIKMFASGISFLIAFQTFVVIGGVTRVIPMTGATIPFVAKGGSALLSSWIMLALLVRMSNNARKPSPVAIQDEGATQVISR